jgi:hypothetical protein
MWNQRTDRALLHASCEHAGAVGEVIGDGRGGEVSRIEPTVAAQPAGDDRTGEQ